MKYLALLIVTGLSAQTWEIRALAISREIEERHIPFGTVLNPMYAGPQSTFIDNYTRCGDSAIWTGHWLAAESFRYAVTRTPAALASARRAFNGLRSLADVTGAHRLLARCVVDPRSPFAAGPRSEERSHGEYAGEGGLVWIGNTSRDQYMGAFFGLSTAFEHVPELRAEISPVATRLIEKLLDDNWAVVMPNGRTSTVFWLRPDQQLSILQQGRQVNPGRFAGLYEERRRTLGGIDTVMALEALELHESYFKFNLNAVTWFNLLRLEETGSPKYGAYLEAYRIFRRAVAAHGNAFFNVVDRALTGPDPRRDAETNVLLSDWLLRPRRDDWVDLRGKYRACAEDRACDPIPVPERVRTDFLWQRSPFLLYGGGSGRIEGAGIDFILPYWMARHYGIDAELVSVSAASGAATLAPSSIATLYATGFPPNPTVRIDGRLARVFYSSATQINFLVPPETTPGTVRIAVGHSDGATTHSTAAEVARIAPGLFSADSSGKGVAAAVAVQNGNAVSVFRCSGPVVCIALPLEPKDGQHVYLSLFGTGLRNGFDFRAEFEGSPVPVLYAGPQPEFPGLDQINIRLDSTMRTRGQRNIYLTVDGVAANAVQILVR